MAGHLLLYFLCKLRENAIDEVIQVIQNTKQHPIIFQAKSNMLVISENCVSKEATPFFVENDVHKFCHTFVELAPSAYTKCKSPVLNVFWLIENEVAKLSHICNGEKEVLTANLCKTFHEALGNDTDFYEFLDMVPEGMTKFRWIEKVDDKLKEGIQPYDGWMKLLKVNLQEYTPSKTELAEFNKFSDNNSQRHKLRSTKHELFKLRNDILKKSTERLQAGVSHFQQIDPLLEEALNAMNTASSDNDIKTVMKMIKKISDKWEELSKKAL